jgi:predicted mannosyl-3-phosphoglycerate phosphatase (HAD superfamily)
MLLIFTNLDGTLLDHKTYSIEEALPALQLIKNKEKVLYDIGSDS